MKKTVLRIAALLFLMHAINPVLVFAEEAGYEYEAYEVYEEEVVAEITWQQIRVPLDSPLNFFLRAEGEVTVNTKNDRNWLWILHPFHINWLENQGVNM